MRKLPTDPGKRRLQIFKRLYQHLQHFRALLESGEMDLPGIVTIPETGEEVYLADLMVGIDSLPPRQREAFDMICLQGFTETDATKVMLPDSRWSTPCQQYADTALERMVRAYDQYQEGTYIYTVYIGKTKKSDTIKEAEAAKITPAQFITICDQEIECPDAVLPDMSENR